LKYEPAFYQIAVNIITAFKILNFLGWVGFGHKGNSNLDRNLFGYAGKIFFKKNLNLITMVENSFVANSKVSFLG